MDLSIIILSYKSKNHLEVLLPSIWASEGVSFEGAPAGGRGALCQVILVDNDSHDGTLEWLSDYAKASSDKHKIKVIPNVNNGFSKGNNLGIKQSSGKYILLLNPDTKLS